MEGVIDRGSWQGFWVDLGDLGEKELVVDYTEEEEEAQGAQRRNGVMKNELENEQQIVQQRHRGHREEMGLGRVTQRKAEDILSDSGKKVNIIYTF